MPLHMQFLYSFFALNFKILSTQHNLKLPFNPLGDLRFELLLTHILLFPGNVRSRRAGFTLCFTLLSVLARPGSKQRVACLIVLSE